MVGGGLYGFFGEQGLPVGVQEFKVHKGRVDYLSRQFVPELYSPNGESVLANSGRTSLLVELIGVAA